MNTLCLPFTLFVCTTETQDNGLHHSHGMWLQPTKTTRERPLCQEQAKLQHLGTYHHQTTDTQKYESAEYSGKIKF